MIEWHELIIKEGSEIRKQIGKMMFGRELTDFEYTPFREYFENFEPSIEINRRLKSEVANSTKLFRKMSENEELEKRILYLENKVEYLQWQRKWWMNVVTQKEKEIERLQKERI